MLNKSETRLYYRDVSKKTNLHKRTIRRYIEHGLVAERYEFHNGLRMAYFLQEDLANIQQAKDHFAQRQGNIAGFVQTTKSLRNLTDQGIQTC